METGSETGRKRTTSPLQPREDYCEYSAKMAAYLIPN